MIVWGAGLRWKLASKGAKPEGENKLRTKGYGVVDLNGWWKPTKGMTISSGVYNVFDKKYLLASDINDASTEDYAGNPVNFDPYTQPGRNFSVNFKYEF